MYDDELIFEPKDAIYPELNETPSPHPFTDILNEEFNFDGEAIEETRLPTETLPDEETTSDESQENPTPTEEPRLGYSFWGKCRFCGCQHFVTAPDSVASRCKCGHMDFNHDRY